jgi:hypothetical protein
MAVLRRKHRDSGYLLVEWMTFIFLYGTLFSGLYIGIAGYEKALAMIQVESAAREFAQDLLRTRERALAGSESGFVELSSGRKVYWVYRRPNLVEKKRDFASAGSVAIQFTSIPAYIIKFSINGSPSASGLFVLQHERITSVQVKVSLQPVTGRVQVERVNL